MARKNSRPLSVAIDEEDHENLMILSAKLDLPVSHIIRKLVKEYLAKH
jgi:hypothetical protein